MTCILIQKMVECPLFVCLVPISQCMKCKYKNYMKDDIKIECRYEENRVIYDNPDRYRRSGSLDHTKIR